MIIARPASRKRSSPSPCCGGRRRDLREPELGGRPVDEGRPEQQHRRAEAADDEVLQAGLERALHADVVRAEDVERDREPLEAEEERHEVRRGDEEDHPRGGSQEERVVLGAVPSEAVSHGDRRRQQADRADEEAGEGAEPVAHGRAGDDALRPLAVGEEERGGDGCPTKQPTASERRRRAASSSPAAAPRRARRRRFRRAGRGAARARTSRPRAWRSRRAITRTAPGGSRAPACSRSGRSCGR